jgi:hypothetical protein
MRLFSWQVMCFMVGGIVDGNTLLAGKNQIKGNITYHNF